jgi:hypothetical protein
VTRVMGGIVHHVDVRKAAPPDEKPAEQRPSQRMPARLYGMISRRSFGSSSFSPHSPNTGFPKMLGTRSSINSSRFTLTPVPRPASRLSGTINSAATW